MLITLGGADTIETVGSTYLYFVLDLKLLNLLGFFLDETAGVVNFSVVAGSALEIYTKCTKKLEFCLICSSSVMIAT